MQTAESFRLLLFRLLRRLYIIDPFVFYALTLSLPYLSKSFCLILIVFYVRIARQGGVSCHRAWLPKIMFGLCSEFRIPLDGGDDARDDAC